MANPTLSTLNGREASFHVVTTSRYWDPRTVVNSGNNSGKDENQGNTSVVSSFKTVETGIKLKLKPWVSASGEITVEIQPEISDSAGTSSGSSLPQTNDRTVQTTVRVKDGETIIIGGLIQQTEYIDTAKVPILGDLPIIGFLFRSQNKTVAESEFIIAIKCNLVSE